MELSGGELDIVEQALEGQEKRGDLARPLRLAEMIMPHTHKLPDMTFAVNALAEVSWRAI